MDFEIENKIISILYLILDDIIDFMDDFLFY